MAFDESKVIFPDLAAPDHAERTAALARKVLGMEPDELAAVPEEERLSWTYGLVYPKGRPMDAKLNPPLIYGALAQILLTYQPSSEVVDAIVHPIADWKERNKGRLFADRKALWMDGNNTPDRIDERLEQVRGYIHEWLGFFKGTIAPRKVMIDNEIKNNTYMRGVYQKADGKLVATNIVFKKEEFYHYFPPSLLKIKPNFQPEEACATASRSFGTNEPHTRALSSTYHEFIHLLQAQAMEGWIPLESFTQAGLTKEVTQKEILWWSLSAYHANKNTNIYNQLWSAYPYGIDPWEVFNLAVESHPRYPFPSYEKSGMAAFDPGI
jgi:hypothetical protein